ncbi:flagellar hook-length control protein FliK [Polynucleobacter sp. MWH-Berg-3C6]|uniref:flagellar hook-length control protein FliK n=1 Tax=Polynucleobacter sp. MWH-Berg-3C6 TaxID=1855882 RepID=UPI001C0C6FBC|nr:flagellar hook-length control protein FliK [Polynucleobacter sp. MWH-Berg-3C6]MBU3551621.1 flagellar hook-length control protein FliK [Polynucleobacter sp. MWH-Berg-3C6]
MANIDPVRLLKANPAENLSNLNTVDQGEIPSDQSLTSFPEELQAAKQSNKEEDLAFDKNSQNSPDTQSNLQNLPVNAAIATKEPANIADKSKNSKEASLDGLAPGGPTLTQLEVAQAITVDEGVVSQAAASIAAAVDQGAQIQLDTQSDADQQTIGALAGVVDPAIAALAAAQAQVVAAPQNIVTPVSTESATQGVDSIASASTQVPGISYAVSDATSANDVAQALAANSATSDLAQNISQDGGAIDAKLDQAALVANTAQANADSLADSAINTINAASVAKGQQAVGPQLAADTNVLPMQPIDQAETANVVAGPIALNVQNETPLVNANTLLATKQDAASAASANQANQVVQAAELTAANVQDLDAPASGIQSAIPSQVSKNAQDSKSSLTTVDLAKADAVDTVDLANLPQTSATNSLRVDPRGASSKDAGEAVQSLRADNAKIASINFEKSAAIDGLAMKDQSPVDLQDLTQTSSSNVTNGLSDFNARNAISPFNQELRLAQSSQTLKLEPQQASLATGPLHVEVMRVLKEGGGRVIMEVTPPDQGAIQLDLRLDGNGRAYLIVEGASDSTKARLEQGGAQLKEQLAQMGLSLSMDMRDRSDQSGHIPFALSNNFSNAANGEGAQVDVALGELMSISRPGITPDGRVSIYA